MNEFEGQFDPSIDRYRPHITAETKSQLEDRIGSVQSALESEHLPDEVRQTLELDLSDLQDARNSFGISQDELA